MQTMLNFGNIKDWEVFLVSEKNKMIGFKVSVDEKKEIVDFADTFGMDISNFVRMCVFEKIRSKTIMSNYRVEHRE